MKNKTFITHQLILFTILVVKNIKKQNLVAQL